MNQTLTAEQALQVLDQVAAKYSGNREEHALIAKAVQVINQLIETTTLPN